MSPRQRSCAFRRWLIGVVRKRLHESQLVQNEVRIPAYVRTRIFHRTLRDRRNLIAIEVEQGRQSLSANVPFRIALHELGQNRERSIVVVPTGLQPVDRLVSDVPVVVGDARQQFVRRVKRLCLPGRRGPSLAFDCESRVIRTDNHVQLFLDRPLHTGPIDLGRGALQSAECCFPSKAILRRALREGPSSCEPPDRWTASSSPDTPRVRATPKGS